MNPREELKKVYENKKRYEDELWFAVKDYITGESSDDFCEIANTAEDAYEVIFGSKIEQNSDYDEFIYGVVTATEKIILWRIAKMLGFDYTQLLHASEHWSDDTLLKLRRKKPISTKAFEYLQKNKKNKARFAESEKKWCNWRKRIFE